MKHAAGSEDRAATQAREETLVVQPLPAYEWPDAPARVPDVAPRERIVFRITVVLAAASILAFLGWLLQPEHVGEPWLYWPLTGVTVLLATGWFLEWLNYWNLSAPAPRAHGNERTVDVFTTACPGEPREMIVRTLVAMTRIRHPHRDFLCDEGNDPYLREVCSQLGVVHVTRDDRKDAKAGNINNALGRSDGEICVVLDPDHEPCPEILDRTLGYFDDPRVGFVQTIQAYRNQGESLIARGAAEQTYHFYGPILMGMHGLGTVQAIGANCIFRRAALESIGGHAPGLAEDMHTAMRLYSRGWRSVYVPEALTRGLVPANLAEYYRQQLKWSCGVFDLLFGQYPRLARGFTLWQRLHYLIAPVYFLRGVITTVGMCVAVLSLLLARSAWSFEPLELLRWALPAVFFTLLVRQSAQRWLLSPSERGFHILGGVLLTGTWWVHLIGFLCSCARVRVPYLPTPKDGRARDDLLLAAPNAAAAAVCLVAAVVGLRLDSSPYTLVMAGMAIWHAVALSTVAVLGQQRTLARLRRTLRVLVDALRPARLVGGRFNLTLQSAMREYPVAAAVLACAAMLPLSCLPVRRSPGIGHEMPWSGLIKAKETGGFYSGVYLPGENPREAVAEVARLEERSGLRFGIVSLYQSWGPGRDYDFPLEAARAIRRRGAIPMITWEPWTRRFDWPDSLEWLREDRRVFAEVLLGRFDEHLRRWAGQLRDFGEPVFLRFAHEMDNPMYPWSEAGGNTAEEFVLAWRYVVKTFQREGASNVAWVWSPLRSNRLDDYFPGRRFVDWIGLTALNYGEAGGAWRPLPAIYEPFRRWRRERGHEHPVLFAEFGSTAHGGDPARWVEESLLQTVRSWPEVEGIVFFHSDRDRNWPTPWRPASGAPAIDWTFLDREGAAGAVLRALGELPPGRARDRREGGQVLRGESGGKGTRSPLVAGRPGEFRMEVDGRDFYVRGVAYNPGHDWRDGGSPPVRAQLERDFEMIRRMGANTIRRYGTSPFDRTILSVAAEKGLRVLYGFWLDQDLDYAEDSAKLDDLEERIIGTVASLRDDPAIAGWCLGNEVWGMLHISFAQPHLTRVRQAHVLFVERVARRIRELDPKRPILAAHEDSAELGAALLDFSRGAPSLDASGVNTYEQSLLENLHATHRRFDPSRPLLVTELGHRPYWFDYEELRGDLSRLFEVSASEKADILKTRWEKHIAARRGENLGGIVYCWRERFEATATWFGLTTLGGTPKPEYWALREAWTGDPAPAVPRIRRIRMPAGALAPHTTIPVSVDVEDGGGAGSRIRWRLLGPDFDPVSLSARAGDSGRYIKLRAPGRPATYRLYVEVSSENGIDQANVPIVVQ
jgi:hypothetical protein